MSGFPSPAHRERGPGGEGCPETLFCLARLGSSELEDVVRGDRSPTTLQTNATSFIIRPTPPAGTPARGQRRVKGKSPMRLLDRVPHPREGVFRLLAIIAVS